MAWTVRITVSRDAYSVCCHTANTNAMHTHAREHAHTGTRTHTNTRKHTHTHTHHAHIHIQTHTITHGSPHQSVASHYGPLQVPVLDLAPSDPVQRRARSTPVSDISRSHIRHEMRFRSTAIASVNSTPISCRGPPNISRNHISGFASMLPKRAFMEGEMSLSKTFDSSRSADHAHEEEVPHSTSCALSHPGHSQRGHPQQCQKKVRGMARVDLATSRTLNENHTVRLHSL